ncbi:MAG: ATP synthase A1 subunit C [Candidatus Methanoplasma sp.]|jgi:V/A-type H+-transporting ATPase subunit C|nr:ATP synthase A1 subunit C [Candidatus Methanoplasma sp.]
MFRRNGRKGNYAYTVARVKAKKSLLMGDEDYSKMLMMNATEISRYISEAGYSKEFTDLANRNSGLDLLEHATYLNMAKVFSSILSASKGELHDMVAAYLTKWDIWNLKVILRGKSYGLGIDGIKEDLVPAGSLSSDTLDKLISTDSEEDILAIFGTATHLSFPAEVVAAYKASGNLGDIEDYLDKFHYDRLLASINPASRPSLLFLDYVKREIDMKNFETILKLKAEGIGGEAAAKYFIPGGKEIDEKLALQISNADSVEGAISEASQLYFYEDIKNSIENTATIRGVVSGLKKYEMQQAKKFSHLYPLSVIPVLDFMIHKENEVNNIRVIARGTESGLDRETIKGLLVI